MSFSQMRVSSRSLVAAILVASLVLNSCVAFALEPDSEQYGQQFVNLADEGGADATALYLSPDTLVVGGDDGAVARQGNDITYFAVQPEGLPEAVPAAIDQTSHTVSFHLPFGSNVTALQPQIVVSDGATIAPESGPQSFSSQVVYTVTSEAGVAQNWTVTCTVDEPVVVALASLPAGSIITFAGHRWIVLNPNTGYLLKETGYGPTRSWNGDGYGVASVWEFLNGSFYQSLSTTNRSLIQVHEWTTTVSREVGLISNSEYEQYGPSGLNVITPLPWDEISFDDPTGTWWTRTDGSYIVNHYGQLQEAEGYAEVRPALYLSPTTLISNQPEKAVVHQASEIDQFAVFGQFGQTDIDHVNHTVRFRMPWGSDVTALQPTIAISDGGSIGPASGLVQDFTDPVSYVVQAEAGNSQTWTVICTVNQLAPLSSLAAGTLVQFAGTNWVLLDPALGYLLKQTAYGADRTLSAAPIAFDPGTVGNLAHYLNHPEADGGFYRGLAEADRALIQLHAWTAGDETDEAACEVSCKVGLLSYSEYNHYRTLNIISPLTGVENFNTWWTRTPHDYYGAWFVNTDGILQSGAGISYGTVRPAIYLDPSILIDGGAGGKVTAQANGITALTVAGQVGSSVIDPIEHTVTFHLPSGSSVEALAPSIVPSAGASVSPASGAERDFTQPVNYTVTSAGGIPQVWSVVCVVDSNSAAAITGFAVDNQVGSSEIDVANHSITFHMAYGSNVSSLKPTITVSSGASISPASAAPQDFRGSVSYQVTAANGDQQAWQAYCIIDANTAAEITSFRVTGQVGNSIIDRNQHTITLHVPYGTPVGALQPTVQLSDGATVDRDLAVPVDLANAVTYVVTSEDGQHQQTWTVTCVIDSNTAAEMISFQAPGQVPGSTVIDPAKRTIVFHMAYGSNVSSLSPTFSLSDGAVANPASGATRDFRSPQAYTVTAADGITKQAWLVTCAVDKNTATEIVSFHVPDHQVGDSSIDQGQHTISFHVPYGTPVNSLKPTLGLSPGAIVSPGSTAAVNFSAPVTYTVTSEDGQHQQGWLVTCSVDPNTAAEIISFVVADQVEGSTVIDGQQHTITFHMPYGAVITGLKPSLSCSPEATVDRDPAVAVDFSNPVIYLVTAQAGQQQTWQVTCIVDKNTATEITAFAVPDQQVEGSTIINQEKHTIEFHVPYGTAPASWQPEIGLSAGASISPQGPVDFSQDVLYTVTSEDGKHQQLWRVTCVVDKNPATGITAFHVPGQVGDAMIDDLQHAISFGMAYGSSVQALRPDILLADGATISPLSGEGADFTQAVTYTVTSEDGQHQQQWTVTCVILPNTAADIISFSVPHQAGQAVIDAAKREVIFHLPYGYSASALLPTIGLSPGASMDRDPAVPVNFHSPVLYSVTAEDGVTEQTWLVKCILDPDTSPPPVAKPPVVLPIVSTGAASAITLTTARLHGAIDNAGGADCTRVEFRYRLAEAGSWRSAGAQTVTLGDGASFDADLFGLKPNAEYQFQARAMNQTGWGEGGVVAFTTTAAVLPQVVTYPVSGLTLSGATLNGGVKSNGGAEVSECGFLWGIAGGSNDIISQDGASVQFAAAIGELRPGTLYVCQAYARNLAGTAYGEQLTFQTPGIVVSTLEAVAVTKTTATLRGAVVGADTSLSAGFNLFPDFIGGLPAAVASDGGFSLAISRLKPGTTYYVQAYVDGPGGRIHATTSSSFITPKDLPEVETKAATSVVATGANLNGFISKNFGLPISESGFIWGLTEKPDNRLIVLPGSDGRSLVTLLPRLQRNTTYYYQAYAVNIHGVGYGKVQSFTTLPELPQVTTAQPTSDGIHIWQAELAGEVVSDGGGITEYGFMYRLRSQQDWQKITVGSGLAPGVFTTSLSAPEPPNYFSYYLVRAYAQNSGGVAYGEVCSIARVPSVTANVVTDSITGSTARLEGRINILTEGTNATTRAFRFRPVGGEWTIVGQEQGEYASNSSFSFELTELKPAQKYEFQAMAQNVAGWGYSPLDSFTTSYGRTDREAALNMRNAGYSVAAIANVLRRVFADSLDAAILALQAAGFGGVEIATGLKGSQYYDSLSGYYSMLTIIRQLRAVGGYDSLTLATALQQVFASEMQWGAYSWRPEWEIAEVLKRIGCSDDQTVRAMQEVYHYEIPAAAAALMRQGQSNLRDISIAISHVYGLEAMADWLWRGPYPSYTYSSPGTPNSFVYNLLQAGIDRLEAVRLLQAKLPGLTVRGCIASMVANDYSVAEMAALLEELFACDPAAIAVSLRQAGHAMTPVEEWLVHQAGVTPTELAQIMTAAWPTPSSAVPAALLNYYQLDGRELAKALYSAGWTEANQGYGPSKDGCGLHTVISVMIKQLGLSTPDQIIGILRELGFSPLGVAQLMGYSSLLFGTSVNTYFLPAYQRQGYSATDAGLWVLDAQARYNFTANHVIDSLCRFSGYSLPEIVLAIRNIYQWNAATMLPYIIDNSRNFRWGWSEAEIAAAVTGVYQVDPYLAVGQAMQQAGAAPVQIASALRSLLKTDEMRPVAEYLIKLGYSQNEVLTALGDSFYPGSSTRWLAAFRMLSALWKELFPDNKQDMQALLDASGISKPADAITALGSVGYKLDDITLCLRDIFNSSMAKSIDLLTRGGYLLAEVLASVSKMYGADPILARIQAMHDAGSSAQEAAYVLRRDFGVTDSLTVVRYLLQVGYYRDEALLTQVDRRNPTVANLQFVSSLIEAVYDDEADSVKAAWAFFGAIDAATANQVSKRLAGFSPADAARVLRNLFACDAPDVVELFREYYQEEAIIPVLTEVFPEIDPILAVVLGEKQKWHDRLDQSLSRLEHLGVTDPVQLFQYLRDAGYVDDDILQEFLDILQYREAIHRVLQACYGASDLVSMARLFHDQPNLRERFGLGVHPGDVPAQLLAAFPGRGTADVALAVKQAGYVVDKSRVSPPAPGRDMVSWLRNQATREQKNDALAGILGAGGIGLDVTYAREILQFEGYSPLEIGQWLRSNAYSLPDILEGMSQYFNEPRIGAKNALKTMQEMGYGIDDLFRAEVGQYNRLYPGDDRAHSWALRDMFAIGYSFEQVTHAYIRTGGPLHKLPQILWDVSVDYFNDYATHQAAVASGLYNYHHLSAVVVANYAYDAMSGNLSLVDLAKGFLACGDGRYYPAELMRAMSSVGGKYLQDVLVKEGIPFSQSSDLTDGAGLGILRDAGLSADGAATTLHDDDEGWMEALAIMIIAGYSFSDAISALWDNSSYHNAMGADIIGLMSDAGKLAVSPGVFGALKMVGKMSYYGFKMGNAGK